MSALDDKARELGALMDVADLRQQLATANARAEAAEAQLALAGRYGADQWRRGNAGQEPQEFDEWQKEAQP